jgi:predicted permease
MFSVIAAALVPAFFVMGLGYFAGKEKIVDNKHVRSLNTLLMTFALPLSLFIAMAETRASRLSSGLSQGLVLTASMLIIFGISIIISRHIFKRSINETAVQGLNAALPNDASMGLPLLAAVAILFGLKTPELREAILLAAIPAGFFGILFGLNYGVEFQDTDSTLTISSLVGILTLGLAIVLAAGKDRAS